MEEGKTRANDPTRQARLLGLTAVAGTNFLSKAIAPIDNDI